MPGAISQLVSYGAQDVYLTGNPQITFFKAIYRRYTNFAMESIIQLIVCIPDSLNEINIEVLSKLFSVACDGDDELKECVLWL